MAVLGIKDSVTKLEDVRSYIKSDKNYFSILNRPLEDLIQRDLDVDLIHKPSRGLRVRATDPTSNQVEVEPGNYTLGVTITQFTGATLAAVPAASGGNKRIDLVYFRIDTGTVVRTTSAEAPSYGAVVKPQLPAGLDTISLAYLYVGDTGPVFQDGLAVNTDGAIEDIRPAPGSSMGRQIETSAANLLSDVSGGAAGSSERVARADHRHNLNVDVTVPASLLPGNSSATGSAGTYARRDHIHQVPTEANPAAFLTDVAGGSAGVGATFPRADHRHAPNVGATIPGVDGGAGSAGVATVYARSDHFHPLNVVASVPAVLDPLTAATPGVSTFYSRHDHVHALNNVMRGRIIFGQVTSAGGIARSGSGDWSSSRLGLGFYRVTFSVALSTTNYSVTANAFAPTVPGSFMTTIKILDMLTTYVEFFLGDSGGSAKDDAFNFQITIIPV